METQIRYHKKTKYTELEIERLKKTFVLYITALTVI